MGLAAQTRTGRRGKKKRSNYAGAHLNAEVADTLGGVRSRPDAALFLEDKGEASVDAKSAARARRAELEFQEMVDSAIGPKRTEVFKVKRAASKKRVENEPKAAAGLKDLWAEAKVDEAWPVQLMHNHGKGEKRKKLVHSRKSTNHVVQAVKVVHPGASYRPSVDDHKEGLKMLVSKQLAFDTRKEALKTIPSKEASKGMPLTSKDAMEDDSEEEDDEEEEEDVDEEGKSAGSDDQGGSKKRPEAGERLTRAQRNKDRRRRLQEAEHAERLRKKQLAKELINVKQAEKNLDELDEELEERAKEKHDKRQAALLQEPLPRMSSGKVKIVQPSVDVVLPSDLSSTMRNLKPHGGLALARMHSLLVRNITEAPDPDAFQRSKRKREIKDIAVGKKFIEEEHAPGQKKKNRRMMPGGRIDIS